MSNQLLRKSKIVTSQLRDDIPDFKVGSIVAVHYKIIEGGKQRIQIFRGLVVDKNGGTGIDATFSVSKNSGQLKVERTFPLHSPSIAKVEVEAYQRARRSNLRGLFFKTKDLIKTLRAKPVKDAK